MQFFTVFWRFCISWERLLDDRRRGRRCQGRLISYRMFMIWRIGQLIPGRWSSIRFRANIHLHRTICASFSNSNQLTVILFNVFASQKDFNCAQSAKVANFKLSFNAFQSSSRRLARGKNSIFFRPSTKFVYNENTRAKEQKSAKKFFAKEIKTWEMMHWEITSKTSTIPLSNNIIQYVSVLFTFSAVTRQF